MATNSTLNLQDNLVLNNLSEPDFIKGVLDTSFGFNSILQMVNKTGGSPESRDSLKFNVTNIGNLAISSTVGSVAQSGLNLLVTLPTVDTRFRVKAIVRDNTSRVFGKIIAVNGAILTIEPQDVALVAANHFVAGSPISVMGTASGNGTTTGVVSLSQTADTDYGVIAKWRETQNIEIQDRQKSFIKYRGKQWFSTQQMFCLKRDAMAEEMKLVMQPRLLNQTSAVEGDYNQFGGIRWTSVNNTARSTYFPVTAEPTWNEIKQFLRNFKTKKAQMGQQVREVTAYCGSNIIKVVQENINLTTQYTGQNSAFGLNKDSGYNVWIVPIEGLMVRIEQYSLFDNRQLWNEPISVTGAPAMESTMMLVDWTGANTVNGEPNQPTIKPYSFQNANVKTMRALKGMDVFNEFGDGNMAQSEIDTLSWQIINIKGYYVIPENVGWLELVS
jgi:hypothetical protein